MANTYTQLNTHVVFAIKGRENALPAGFAYSRSQCNDVIKYIIKQEEYHHKKTFREEYLNILKTFEISYDESYIFEFYE